MKFHTVDKVAMCLVIAGVGFIFAGMYVWVPLFYVGATMMLIGGILWNPLDLF
jgi:uncharacterized protein (DUF983 family)